MITRFANLTSRLAVVLVTLCTIAACGGGGGGGDGGFLPDDGPDGSTLFLAMLMLDAKGNPTDTVTSTAPVTLQVKVTKKNKNGAPVPGVVVNTTSDIGQVFPASGTALSNDSGIATFQIEAGDDKGAGLITSTAQSDAGQPTTSTLSVQIGNSGLRLGYFDADGDFIENEIAIAPSGTLVSSGNAQLSLSILNEDGQLASTSESVRFSSGCIASGQALLAPVSPVVSGDGRVSTTYTAFGCSGTDEITASLVGATAQAFGTLSIAPPTANRLTFVSADPTLIVLKGTGGGPNRQEFADLVFRAVDRNNMPLQGIKVDFSLTTDVGGLSVSPATAISDGDGNVKVSIFAGDVATVVRVIATTPGGDGTGEVSTVSDVLSVSTGLPDQNSISLSVSDPGFVIENGMTVDGITRNINVSMADKFNNPVPDGTAAIFTTEYGVIQPSCTTTDGTCFVVWSSSNPRSPTLDTITDSIETIFSPGYNCSSHNGNSGPCPDDLGFTRGGRSTILVTAIGEESFIDRNGNGLMDQDEQDLFDNIPEAFLDNNEDNIFNPAAPGCKGLDVDDASGACLAGFEEIFSDFNSNGAYDLNDDPAVYNGLLCPLEGDGVWCSRELVNVRDDAVLILSADPAWDIGLYRDRSPVSGTTTGGSYTAYVSDLFNNKPPAGVKVSVTATESCEITVNGNDTVPNTSATGAFAVNFIQFGEIEYDSCTDPLPDSIGELTIKIGTEGDADGLPYSETYACVVQLIDTAPDPLCPPPEIARHATDLEAAVNAAAFLLTEASSRLQSVTGTASR